MRHTLLAGLGIALAAISLGVMFCTPNPVNALYPFGSFLVGCGVLALAMLSEVRP